MRDENEPSPASTGSVSWIPVTERLPDDGTWCWVDWDGPGNPFPALRDIGAAGGWTNHDTWEDFDNEVTRWSPLTAPPNGSR